MRESRLPPRTSTDAPYTECPNQARSREALRKSLVILLRQDRAGRRIDDVVWPTALHVRVLEPVFHVPTVRLKGDLDAIPTQIRVDFLGVKAGDLQGLVAGE